MNKRKLDIQSILKFSFPMPRTQEQQQDAFERDLLALIDRYVSEWDLTICSAIGTLEAVKLQLFMDSAEEEELP